MKLTGINQALFNSARLSPFIQIWLGGEWDPGLQTLE